MGANKINFSNIITMTNKEELSNRVEKNIEDVTQNVKIDFPVTFNLKAVVDSTNSDEENIKNLSVVFDELKVTNAYIGNKKSSKGSYISYNYKVTLLTKTQLEELYSKLKSVKGLKFAI